MRDEVLGNANAYLIRVLSECRAKTFAMWSQCHCLRGLHDVGYTACNWPEAIRAEDALSYIGLHSRRQIYWLEAQSGEILTTEPLRRLRVLPIVLAEIDRRYKRISSRTDAHVENLA